MLDRLREKVISDTLDAHIANCFKTDVATHELSKRLLNSSLSTAPIASVIRAKTDTAMKNKKYSTTLESKDLIDTVEPYIDESE